MFESKLEVRRSGNDTESASGWPGNETACHSIIKFLITFLKRDNLRKFCERCKHASIICFSGYIYLNVFMHKHCPNSLISLVLISLLVRNSRANHLYTRVMFQATVSLFVFVSDITTVTHRDYEQHHCSPGIGTAPYP